MEVASKMTFAKKLAIAGILLPLLVSATRAVAQSSSGNDSIFGSSKRTAGVLIGILYDFKQDQKRQQTQVGKEAFEQAVTAFVESGYDEGLLNKYYRVPRALYTSQLHIPTINADSAPKAFGVEKMVEPRRWVVHYKGQIAPPEDGAYRFVGDADDFVFLAINGKTVLVAEHPNTPMHAQWQPKENAPEPYRTSGDWLNLRAGEPVDIDIVTGESPGGSYRCLIGVQKRGGPILPFRLSVSQDTQVEPGSWRGIP